MATSQSTPYQALYRACMKEAAAQGRNLMQRLVARASLAMPERARLAADAQQGRQLADAARVLAKHEAALCEAYPQALLAEFAQAIAGAPRGGGLRFDALELMDDHQVQESVDQLRIQQVVLHEVEAELTELNALVCAVQGLTTVQADRNPLRPEVYVRSLRSVVQQSPVPAEVRSRWMLHLGEALGPELAQTYRELSGFLRRQGVGEAGYTLAAAGSPPGTPIAGADAKGEVSTLLTVRALQRLLAGELDLRQSPATDAATRPAEFTETVPAAFEALQEMRQVDAVMQRLAQRQLQGGAAEGGTGALRQALRAEAHRPGQVLGLEVVNLMVENLAADQRLLAPVRDAVRALEPALLRLALADSRFFSDRQHPARRLLDQMTRRSLAWKGSEEPGFAGFIAPLREAVDALAATAVTGPEPFDFALQTLQEAWDEGRERERRQREKAVRALLQAEQRNLLAARIAAEQRARPELAHAPREVVAFVTGPWSQVMAHARLADGAGDDDPGGYADAVSDLLWSVQPMASAAAAARLAKLLPELLDTLRRGLALISYPDAKTRRLFDALALLHQQAVNPGTTGAPLSREELHRLVPDDAEAWLQPSEAQHSGFMDTEQADAPAPLFQPTQPGLGVTEPAAAPAAEEALPLPAEGLQRGAWVELLADGSWARYQLTWSSPHGTLFMFSAAGGKTQSMTRRLLSKMLQNGSLRLVSGEGVVDGALDAVAAAALRNSLDLRL